MKPLQSIKVAGEVVSMDVCGDYLAVGSTVTQMIDISNDEFPRKIFFAQQDDFSNVCLLLTQLSHIKSGITLASVLWLYIHTCRLLNIKRIL